VQRLREQGASRVVLPGVLVEFGPTATPVAIETPVDTRTEERARKRQLLDTMYAAVGGWSGTDEELDRMNGYGGL
jgi:hypothetical protein